MGGASVETSTTAIPVVDIVRRLSVAADENQRLRENLSKNNEVLDGKMQEITETFAERDRESEAVRFTIVLPCYF